MSASYARPPEKEQMFKCQDCDSGFPYYSCLGYIWDNSKDFLRQYDADATKARDILGEVPFKPLASKARRKLVCYKCCGRYHKTSYLKANGKLTSKWRNAADLSKGRTSKGKLARAIKTMASMLGPEKGPELKEVMEKVKNDRIAKATDWIPEIGPDTFFAYGCSGGGGCGIHPLRASQWYRMSNATTANGCFSKGFWVCAHCTTRYTGKNNGHKRLLFYPSTKPGQSVKNGERAYLMAFWGNHDVKKNSEFEQQLTILKGSKLVTELNGKEISYENVMQAVEAISDRAEISIKKHYKGVIKWYESVQPVHDKFSTKVYCDDARLSLGGSGVRFPAVDVRAFENEIPFFSSDELQQLFDVCSAFYDLSTYQSEGTRDAVGPADKKMIAKMKERRKQPSVQAVVAAVCDADASRAECVPKRQRLHRAQASSPSQR